VSSIEQADPERDGIPRQLRHIDEHCKKFNLVVDKEFRLEGISGTKVQYNPQFIAMLRRLADPDIVGVVFSRMDRFFRPEHLDSYEIFKTFRKHKKLLFCDLASTDGLDVTKAQDQTVIQIWGIVAAQERRNIAERNREGKNASRLKPDRKSDPLPMGVLWDSATGLFSYDGQDSAKVRTAFQKVLQGATLSSVVRELGFTSQTGLRKILQNQWWIGNKTHLYKRHYRDEADTVGKKVLLDEPVVVPTNLAKTPLISPAEFIRVQSILAVKRTTWTQNKAVGENFLGPGLLRCACGRAMYLKKGASYGVGKGNKPDVYICASKAKAGSGSKCLNLPAPDIDDLIVWTATKYFTNEQHIKAAIESSASAANRSELESECERLTKSVRKIESRRDAAIELSLEHREYVPKVKALSDQLLQAKTALARTQAMLSTHLTQTDIASMASRLRERFISFGMTDEWSQADRKRLLLETVQCIRFNNDGTLEFVLRGGVLLKPLADDELLDLYFLSTLDLPKAVAGFDPEKRERMKEVLQRELAKLPKGIPHPAVERVQKLLKKRTNSVATLETRDRAAITAIQRGNAAARAASFSAIWARSAALCWIASICTLKFLLCPTKNCDRTRKASDPGKWPSVWRRPVRSRMREGL